MIFGRCWRSGMRERVSLLDRRLRRRRRKPSTMMAIVACRLSPSRGCKCPSRQMTRTKRRRRGCLPTILSRGVHQVRRMIPKCPSRQMAGTRRRRRGPPTRLLRVVHQLRRTRRTTRRTATRRLTSKCSSRQMARTSLSRPLRGVHQLQ